MPSTHSRAALAAVVGLLAACGGNNSAALDAGALDPGALDAGATASDAGCDGVSCGSTCCTDDQTCDTANHLCMAATCSTACSGKTPSCNPTTLACECTSTSCASGEACVVGTCEAASTCDPACSGETPSCDPATLTCRCAATSCGAGKACDPATGQCACNPACSGTTPDCSPATNTCVCNSGSCAATQTCSAAGQCVSATCAQSCSGETPTCDSAKNACVCTATSCTGGKTCTGGTCVQGGVCTIADILDAANRTNTFIQANKRLPNYVAMGTVQVSMPAFLDLMVAALSEIESGSSAPIAFKTVAAATSPKDTSVQGKILQAEYLKIASDAKTFIDTNGRAPDYASPTSLGTYLGFTNLVYMFAMVLDSYGANSKLPDYVQLVLFSQAPLASGPAKGIWVQGTTVRGHEADFVAWAAKYHFSDLFVLIKGVSGSSAYDVLDAVIAARESSGAPLRVWAWMVGFHDESHAGSWTYLTGNWVSPADTVYRAHLQDVLKPALSPSLGQVHLPPDGVMLDDSFEWPGSTYGSSTANRVSTLMATLDALKSVVTSASQQTGHPILFGMAPLPETSVYSSTSTSIVSSAAHSYGQDFGEIGKRCDWIAPETYRYGFYNEPSSWIGTVVQDIRKELDLECPTACASVKIYPAIVLYQSDQTPTAVAASEVSADRQAATTAGNGFSVFRYASHSANLGNHQDGSDLPSAAQLGVLDP